MGETGGKKKKKNKTVVGQSGCLAGVRWVRSAHMRNRLRSCRPHQNMHVCGAREVFPAAWGLFENQRTAGRKQKKQVRMAIAWRPVPGENNNNNIDRNKQRKPFGRDSLITNLLPSTEGHIRRKKKWLSNALIFLMSNFGHVNNRRRGGYNQ